MPMTFSNAAQAGFVAFLAAMLAGCGPGPAPDTRALPRAQEINRATHEAFGDHVVHFNAQSTTMLTPEVARAFGIRRSEKRAMLNIAVLRQDSAPPGTPVSAEVAVQASNLLGQQKGVRVRELREGEAIYYIGEFGIANEEIVNFTVSVRPEGAGQPYEFKFRQQFYRN
jgi:hypothetical protein